MAKLMTLQVLQAQAAVAACVRFYGVNVSVYWTDLLAENILDELVIRLKIFD